HKDAVMLKNKKMVPSRRRIRKLIVQRRLRPIMYMVLFGLRRYILKMYRNNKFWWKKDPLVIPRGLAWSKIGNFEKGDYGALFAEWSNPILYGQPNCPITASPQGIQPIIYAAIVHDPQFEQEPKQVVESVPLFTRDGDPSIVLKDFTAGKQRMNAIKRFIKSRNDNLSEDLVVKQSVEKEIESSDGKEMSMYVNEVNVVNQNQPLSSEKVVGQLTRNRFVRKALVEPYTVQSPTTAPSAFLKVERKRLKRKARMLQIQNTQISFDDDVGDDDPDFKVLFGRMGQVDQMVTNVKCETYDAIRQDVVSQTMMPPMSERISFMTLDEMEFDGRLC
nr:phospholipase-like protein [Tanacetum cinerariifolium]